MGIKVAIKTSPSFFISKKNGLKIVNVHELIGKEEKRYKEFRQYHWEKCHNSGNYIIHLIGTGIGETIEIGCPYCKETKNITDVDAW